ncbi:MAG: hypothetical protein M3Y81_10335 [Chloroflexota bacterium]|nr:hypothetical protein [Chloroflexota bacterium]
MSTRDPEFMPAPAPWPVGSPPRRPRRRRRYVWRTSCGCLVLLLLCCSASFVVSLFGHQVGSDCAFAQAGDLVLVGAARADISPQQPVYLGGYGFGPVRLSTGVLQPLFVRALAVRSLDNLPGHTLVFAALDSQGYFAAYQSGPYGIADMRATLATRLGIPVRNIIIASTHSHAAPDTVGFWGGVPDSYLARVHDQTISAISQAVAALAPAQLRVGTVSIAGYTASFPGWGTDSELRVLQAVSRDGKHTLATLVNVSVHPTALGAGNLKAAPDWPGVTADTLEAQLGGTAIIMIGALGHTWPGSPDTGAAPEDRTMAYQLYGAFIAQRAVDALHSARVIDQPTLCAADHTFREVDSSAPLLFGLQLLGRSGHERIMRSLQSPYFVPPDVLGVEVETLRIGDVFFFAAPVEAYPSLLAALRSQVHASAYFFLGLANDQLGYATQVGEYTGAVRASPSDEALFIISPSFGDDIVRELVIGAQEIG